MTDLEFVEYLKKRNLSPFEAAKMFYEIVMDETEGDLDFVKYRIRGALRDPYFRTEAKNDPA